MFDHFTSTLIDTSFEMASYRELIEGTDEGFWVIGADGRTIFANQAIARMLGYEKIEMLSRPLWDFLDEEGKATASFLGRLPEAEVPSRMTISFQRKNGSCLRATVATTKLGPALIGANSVLLTVIETKDERSDVCQGAVATPQYGPHTTQLLAEISHELRNSLNSILGYANLIVLDNLDGETTRACARTISRAGDSLLRLVNDIVDLGKIEAGKFRVETEAFSLPDLLADIHGLLRLKATEKKLTFQVASQCLLPRTVVSDPGRMKQILTNVVGNAIKFTREGSVRVLVRCDPEAGEDGKLWLHFTVVDTGIGIPPEAAGRLFKSYEQGHADSARAYGGTGLGLKLSRQLAQALGGDVKIMENQPAKGAAFSIELPVGLVENEPTVTVELDYSPFFPLSN